MKLSRRQALFIHTILDQWVPPAIRDANWFMMPMFHFLFGRKAAIFSQFKDLAPSMGKAQFIQTYRDVEDVLIDRLTSLNEKCIQGIQASIQGETVLEVGCGNGYLANILSSSAQVTGVDIIITPETRAAYPQVRFEEGDMEKIPFPDKSYDTVVSTHTLEHVQDLPAAMRELRRVARRRLILVTPRQRPYRYTFDLHLNFFPYPHSLLQAVGQAAGRSECKVVGGDLFLTETYMD